MRHRHLRSQRWSLEAVRSCLERGGLVQWRGLMRVVWADPHGDVAGRLERVLELTAEDSAGQEGGVDSVTHSLWRAYLHDAREWRAAHQ